MAEPAEPQPPPRPPPRGKGLGSRAANAGLRALRSFSPRGPLLSWSGKSQQAALPETPAAAAATSTPPGRFGGSRSSSASEASLPELTNRPPVAPPRSHSSRRPSPRNVAATPRSSMLQPSLDLRAADPVTESVPSSRQLPALRQVPQIPPQTLPLVPPGAYIPGTTTATGTVRASGTSMAAAASPRSSRRSMSARESSSRSSGLEAPDGGAVSGSRTARGSSCRGHHKENGAEAASSWFPQASHAQELDRQSLSSGDKSKLDDHAQKLLDAVFDFPMAEEAALFLLGANPELSWLAQCVQRCPLPPCWSTLESRNGLEAARYVDMGVGTVTDSPPLLDDFVQLARVMLFWRSNPGQGGVVAERLAFKHDSFLAEAKEARRSWSGPHVDPGTGFEYWYNLASQQSTWGDPGAAPEFLARVIDKLRQSMPNTTEKRSSGRSGKARCTGQGENGAASLAGWSKLPSWMQQPGEAASSTSAQKGPRGGSESKESLRDVGAEIQRERSSSRRKRSERKHNTAPSALSSEDEQRPKTPADAIVAAPSNQDLHLRAGSQRRRPQSCNKLEPISHPPTPKAAAVAADLHVMQAPKPPPEIVSSLEAFKLEMLPKVQKKPDGPEAKPTTGSRSTCENVAPCAPENQLVAADVQRVCVGVAGSPEESDAAVLPVADSVIQKLDDIFDDAVSGASLTPTSADEVPHETPQAISFSDNVPHETPQAASFSDDIVSHHPMERELETSDAAAEVLSLNEPEMLQQSTEIIDEHQDAPAETSSPDACNASSPSYQDVAQPDEALQNSSMNSTTTESYHTASQAVEGSSQTSIVEATPVHSEKPETKENLSASSEQVCEPLCEPTGVSALLEQMDTSNAATPTVNSVLHPSKIEGTPENALTAADTQNQQGAEPALATLESTHSPEAEENPELSAFSGSDRSFVTAGSGGDLKGTLQVPGTGLGASSGSPTASFNSGDISEEKADVQYPEHASSTSSGSPTASQPSLEVIREEEEANLEEAEHMNPWDTGSPIAGEVSDLAVAREPGDTLADASARSAAAHFKPDAEDDTSMIQTSFIHDASRGGASAKWSPTTSVTPQARDLVQDDTSVLQTSIVQEATARGSPMTSFTPQPRSLVHDDMSLINTSVVQDRDCGSAALNRSTLASFTPQARLLSHDDSSIIQEAEMVLAEGNEGLLGMATPPGSHGDESSMMHESQVAEIEFASNGPAMHAFSSAELPVSQPKRVIESALTWVEQQGYGNAPQDLDFFEDLTWGPAPAFEDIYDAPAASTVGRLGKSTSQQAPASAAGESCIPHVPGSAMSTFDVKPKKPPRSSAYRASPLRTPHEDFLQTESQGTMATSHSSSAQEGNRGHASKRPAVLPKGPRPQGCSRVRMAPVGGA